MAWSALREAAESARNQRETIVKKLDELDGMMAEFKGAQGVNVVMPKTAIESLSAFVTTKNLLVVLGFLALLLGLLTAEDIKSFIPVVTAP